MCWLWDSALVTSNQSLAKAIPPPSLDSSVSSSGSRPEAGDISLVLICLHSTQLATSSLSVFLSPSLILSDAEIWFGESREKQKGVKHISIQPPQLSLSHYSSRFPLRWYHSNSLHFISPSLSTSFFLSLQCAIIITPLLDTQAINQGLPSSCACLPWRGQKPIKGWLNYSCWLPQTPVYNTVGLTVGWVWVKCDGMLGVGKNWIQWNLPPSDSYN